MFKNVKILGVLCAKRETFQQKVVVSVKVIWVERAHRATQTQTTES